MIIDLHVHEATYSQCSKMSLDEIVTAAKEKGLDAVCITDHDSMDLAEFAHDYSKKSGFPIFIGAEIYTLEGDMVSFGLKTLPEKRIGVAELLNTIQSLEGYCFAAHPFRNNRRGLEDKLDSLRGFSASAGIEVLNGNTDAPSNKKALLQCLEMQLQAIGGSDAHRPESVGVFATFVPGIVKNERELIVALRSGRCYPVVWSQNGYIPYLESALL